MKKKSAEFHIVIDRDGICCVQIVGPAEVHAEGHEIYLQIRDLVQKLDKEIQERLGNGKKGDEFNA